MSHTISRFGIIWLQIKEARESFYVEGRLVPSKYNPTRDQRAAVRGFQPASISSCKQYNGGHNCNKHLRS